MSSENLSSMYDRVWAHVPNKPPVEVNDFRIATDRKIAYPSEWFKKHNKKPDITVIPIPKTSLTAAYYHVLEAFNECKLTPDLAVGYIWAVFDEHPTEIGEKWESFGITIAEEKTKVRLQDLATITTGEAPTELKATTNPEPQLEDVKDLILALLMVYRLATSPDLGEYRDSLRSRAEKLIMNTKAFKNLRLSFTKLQSFIGTPSYVMTVAFVDMYFHRFPQHQFAKARLGTVTTRFKDCSVLASTKAISDSLGCDLRKLSVWIWTPGARDDFLRINQANEEMDKDYSYAMYFMELGLSKKSPYSASVNYNLHFFYHAIGCGLGIPRSINARFVNNPEAGAIMQNSSVVIYAYVTTNSFLYPFMPYKDPPSASKFSKEVKTVEAGSFPLPTRADPIDWINYIKSLDNCVPEEIRRHAHRHWKVPKVVRSGTIGEYLLNYARGASVSRPISNESSGDEE